MRVTHRFSKISAQPYSGTDIDSTTFGTNDDGLAKNDAEAKNDRQNPYDHRCIPETGRAQNRYPHGKPKNLHPPETDLHRLQRTARRRQNVGRGGHACPNKGQNHRRLPEPTASVRFGIIFQPLDIGPRHLDRPLPECTEGCPTNGNRKRRHGR
ncbi:hypothetical protein DESC_750025 [Desulfosarcina cetonica]|nr:hypothetical protein DESC_750025 [Desulfosarcina cetonica]